MRCSARIGWGYLSTGSTTKFIRGITGKGRISPFQQCLFQTHSCSWIAEPRAGNHLRQGFFVFGVVDFTGIFFNLSYSLLWAANQVLEVGTIYPTLQRRENMAAILWCASLPGPLCGCYRQQNNIYMISGGEGVANGKKRVKWDHPLPYDVCCDGKKQNVNGIAIDEWLE